MSLSFSVSKFSPSLFFNHLAMDFDMEATLEQIDNGSEEPEVSPSLSTIKLKVFLLEVFKDESRVNSYSPLCRHHPDQFVVFDTLVEANPNSEEFDPFCQTVRAEFEEIISGGHKERDVEKLAVSVRQALCRSRFRSSATTCNHKKICPSV